MEEDYQFQDWVLKAQADGIERAKKRIARGEDPEQVLETFSKIITNKLLHPIIQEIKNSSTFNKEEFERSRAEYFEKMKDIGPKSDHVKDDNE